MCYNLYNNWGLNLIKGENNMNLISNISNFVANFGEDLKRALKTNELSGNEALVRKNLNLINEVTQDDYLDNKYNAKAKAELKKVQKHMVLHNDDYIAYFRNEYLKEMVTYKEQYIQKTTKREEYIKNIVLKKKYTKSKWVIGILSFIFVEGFSVILGPTTLPLGIIIALANAKVLPYFYELYHKPYQEGKAKFNKILDNIKDKIDTTIEEESLEQNNPSKQIADLSIKIAACLDLINKEPYPDCIKEQEALIKLNAEFLQDELASKTMPTDSLEPKLIFVSYESRLAEIRRIILEKQKINRSRELVEDKFVGSGLTLDEEMPSFEIQLPTVKQAPTLKRYRIPKN